MNQSLHLTKFLFKHQDYSSESSGYSFISNNAAPTLLRIAPLMTH